ncbi:hypothetical protein WI372_05785 [Gemmatimonadota bacterium DH-20]|uniref:Bacterial surface antigen (D15) domain-containing protein n=1 Tax=Gaopeijia maritima TaxID=3119007 RepID=A0ABU9EA70_9BACT
MRAERAVVVILALALAGPASAQEPGTYLDPAAAALHAAASDNWGGIDDAVVRYTAMVRQRIAAQLRTPLKDRTLYRNESAARVFWDRDHETLTQVLGVRSRYPGRDIAIEEGGLESILDDFTIDGAFDPGGDRLVFGMGSNDRSDDFQPDDDDFWVAHPLAPGADSLYRFRSGDTLVLSLPDGRELRAVRLDVLPRVADVHRMSGSLWIEPESGALVRAAYRLSEQFDAMRDVPDLREEEEQGSFRYVPGIFKPWTFDMEVMAVDYALWDFQVWLPRSARFEGVVAAGVMKIPVSFDLSYGIESVVLDDDLDDLAAAVPVMEEVHFQTRAEAMEYMARLAREQGVGGDLRTPDPEWVYDGDDRLVPRDLARLESSTDLPPPIGDDAAGFTSERELRGIIDDLADLPAPPVEGLPWAANWGLQRPDLVRYNRVEGPAVGGRVQLRAGSPFGPLSIETTGFIGLSDLEPKVRLSIERESLRRRVALGGYREMRALEPRARHLELGNSLNALLFGRDDGEYMLAAGADLVIAPPSARRESWRFRLFAERHDPVEREMNFSLAHAFDGDWRFRPVLPAEDVEEAGAELRISPWWGTDPLAPQIGLDLSGRAAWGRRPDGPDYDYLRGSATLRAAVPLASGRWRVGLEGGIGHIEGEAPLQQSWILGGPTTLRGFDATTTVGRRFVRGRAELGRVFPAWTVTLFGDVAVTRDRPEWTLDGVGRWAPDPEAWSHDDPRWAMGVGASLLDGLVRLDLSRGLTGPGRRTRLDLYLDALF